jgi:hypothetical protein
MFDGINKPSVPITSATAKKGNQAPKAETPVSADKVATTTTNAASGQAGVAKATVDAQRAYLGPQLQRFDLAALEKGAASLNSTTVAGLNRFAGKTDSAREAASDGVKTEGFKLSQGATNKFVEAVASNLLS